MACECGKCTDCRLDRMRRHARDRKARQRSAESYAAPPTDLIAIMEGDPTEIDKCIEIRLRLIEMERQRTRQASRC
jgi:hypothetical protein